MRVISKIIILSFCVLLAGISCGKRDMYEVKIFKPLPKFKPGQKLVLDLTWVKDLHRKKNIPLTGVELYIGSNYIPPEGDSIETTIYHCEDYKKIKWKIDWVVPAKQGEYRVSVRGGDPKDNYQPRICISEDYEFEVSEDAPLNKIRKIDFIPVEKKIHHVTAGQYVKFTWPEGSEYRKGRVHFFCTYDGSQQNISKRDYLGDVDASKGKYIWKVPKLEGEWSVALSLYNGKDAEAAYYVKGVPIFRNNIEFVVEKR